MIQFHTSEWSPAPHQAASHETVETGLTGEEHQAKWISEDQPRPAGSSLVRLNSQAACSPLRYFRSRLVRGKVLLSPEPLASLIRQIICVSDGLNVKLSLFEAQQLQQSAMAVPSVAPSGLDARQPPIAKRTAFEKGWQE